jgi:hypothetical protein
MTLRNNEKIPNREEATQITYTYGYEVYLNGVHKKKIEIFLSVCYSIYIIFYNRRYKAILISHQTK